ncbi:MAG: FtsX-like permease family protein [Bacteroidales bacterium]|nr:FtsX-like permease family protein [Bacteroidales bacterium]
MLPFYRLLSLRYLLQRWDRAALIVASIALGVATLVSTRILNACIETAASQTSTPLGVGELLVVNGEVGILQSTGDDITAAHIPGVKAVQPLVIERAYLPKAGNKAAVLIGAELSQQVMTAENPLHVRFTRTLELTWANAWVMVHRQLVVLSKPLFDEWVAQRSAETDPFLLRYGTRDIACQPIGYIEYADDSPVGMLGRNIVGMEIRQAARTIHPGPPAAFAAIAGGVAHEASWDAIFPIRVNRIDVILEPHATPEQVQQSVQAVVGTRGQVRTPEAHYQTSQEIIGGLQIGFLLCSAGAMVVGLFLVYNALSVTVAERRHDIGILRSIGATRSQIVWLFGTAAVILGVLGALVGIPLGTFLGWAVLATYGQELGSIFVNPEVNPVWPTAATLLLALGAGVVTAVVAALIPALQAAGEDPADAVRRVPGVAGGLWALAHKATCAALVAGGVAVILTRHELPPQFGLHPRIGSFGGLLSALVGLLLAAPILVGMMVRLIHPLLCRILPIEARLAADNLIRSPGRTGVVIGALGAGVAVMIQTAGVGRSNQEPVVQWLDRVIVADRYVFAGNLTEATSSQTPLDPGIVEELRQRPGVAGVSGFRYSRPEFNGTRIMLVALDAAMYARFAQERSTAPLAGMQQLPKLGEGRILISDNFGRKHGVTTGDTLTLPGMSGAVPLTVVGQVQDYSWARGTIFIDRADYARLFHDEQVDVVHIFLDASSTGADSVARFASDRGLTVQHKEMMRRLLADMIDQFYTVAFLQQIVVGVVASLGVVTALLISVMQRRRELGLLLAVGATPAQVVRTVLAEAILMGLFGTLLGIMIGLPLEWYILRVVMVEESGFIFHLLVPWRQTIMISVGTLIISTLAGLLPAWHAVRIRIPDAIAYE